MNITIAIDFRSHFQSENANSKVSKTAKSTGYNKDEYYLK